jgi:VWFA-related protein
VSPCRDRGRSAPFLTALGRATTFVVAFAGLLLTPEPSSAQFRSGVHVVEVDVRVFDADGRFVADLARGDFELLEGGVPQELQSLYLIDALERRAGAPARPGLDPGSSARAQSASAPQTWVFVFDVNHLTPGGGFDRARAAVEAFVRDRFKDGDVAGVVDGTRMVNNRLTSVREELVAAVQGVKPLTDHRSRQMELTREWPRLQDQTEAFQIANEDAQAIKRAVNRACMDEPDRCTGRAALVPVDDEIREKARRLVRGIQRSTTETLTALNALASGLAKMPGPKTIIFLSDGFVAQELETTLRTVVGQTARAGARIYAVDVRGLNRGRGAGIIDQAQADDPLGGGVPFDLQEDGPNSLAVDTGGMMIRNENNVGRALDTIASDANRYYVLGYQPIDTNFDGKFRPIEVRVTRAGVAVRARRGYLALEPSRMLVPQAITTSLPREGGSDETAPIADLPPKAGSDENRAGSRENRAESFETGAIVTAPPTPASRGLRLRPDADNRVEELLRGEIASADALARQGWEAYQRGDVESAVGPLTEAAAQPDVRPWVLYTLGLSQVALGRAQDAVASWERVRGAAPGFAPVYIDLADTYVQLSEVSKALAVLRDAETRWPADPEVHNAIGVIHVRRGALDDAIEAFEKAAAASPQEPLAYFNLGRAYELRYARGQRYVSSQRRWTASDEDRRKAEENYQRYVRLGGPYVNLATEALNRLEWQKR